MYSSKNFKVASLSLSKIISSNSKIFFGSRMTFSSYTYTTSLKYIFIFTPILNGIKLYYVNLISIQKLMGHKGIEFTDLYVCSRKRVVRVSKGPINYIIYIIKIATTLAIFGSIPTLFISSKYH